jgi:hypothetical protein
MSPNAQPGAAGSPRSRSREPRRESLAGRVAVLAAEHAAWWAATPAALPALGQPSSRLRRWSNARATARLVDTLAAELTRLPDEPGARAAWRDSVRERLQDLGERRLGWPAGYRRLLFAEDFFRVSRQFAREARAFDPDLRLADLWQALRNVWIGNSLQMLLERPLALGDGLFAYSMLYPLTDNLLDDPAVDGAAKAGFAERFGARLAGRPALPRNRLEWAAFAMVARMERELPRRRFPDAWESLLAIHRAQLLSLRQQAAPALADDDLVAISCEKGGTSVLADLYLVAGTATADEERFAFGYGVFLQLLDDLQDVESDLVAGHQTAFAAAARRGPLDAPAARLAHFVDDVLGASPLLERPGAADRRDLIRRNCLTLLVGAVAEQPRRFTRRFRREIERQWPFSLGAQHRLRRRAEARFRGAARRLQERTGASSLLDWALAMDDGGG